jgi:acetyl-CoA carboxylase carboxyl transferase subunit alpha
LWKERAAAPKAAEALKITANDLFSLKLVDEIVPEPLGGAHNDPEATAETLKVHLLRHLDELLKMPKAERLKKRYEKFRNHGHFLEAPPAPAEKAPATRKKGAKRTHAPAAA